MPNRICWQQESVDRVLQTEALAGDDSVFLATHFPIEGFETGGSRAAEISAANEQSLFDALSRDTVRHAFCVVRGEPGSGKSHLIRWLNIQWGRKGGNDLVLLIQRADGSLQSTLEQLKQALPVGDETSLWQGIIGSDGIRFEGRVKLFHDALGHSLAANFLEEEKDDLQWCEERSLSELVLAPEVRDGWKAPYRVLEVVSGRHGERNSEMAQFHVADIRELSALAQSIPNRKRAHIRFITKVTAEFEALDDPANSDRPLQQVAPEVFQFMRALNERLNPAIQRFLGISPDGLKELFRRLRRRLRTEGRRLVLLLEDITSFQGVDNLLIDVLVTDSQTRPDECDLISVVGLTPSYFEKFIGGLGNIVARVTHMVRLGRGDHGFETITSLETAEAQVRFTAKYLNAVRLGIEHLRSVTTVPNACDTCPDQKTCFKSFGSSDGYGLYPLTQVYIARNFDRLVDPEGKLTQRTPRGLLQNLVHPALYHVVDLEQGDYPPPEFPIAPIRGALDLAGPVRDRLSATAQGDEEAFARLRLLVGLWGNGGTSVSTSRSSEGELEFVGVREGVFEAFQAPWPGTLPSEQSVESPTPKIPPDPAPAEQTATTESPQSSRRLPRPPSPQGRSSPPKNIRPGDLTTRLQQLSAWEEERPLDDPSFWNQEVRRSIEDLSWEQLGIPYYLWRRLFTRELILLEGTGQARSMHIVVPRAQWVYRGLHSVLCLRNQSGGEDIELMLRYAARFRRKLEQLVLDHVGKRLRALVPQGDEIWDPAHTAIQLLGARAWLRGDVAPGVDLSEQWRVLLSDETEATTAPRQRVDSWGDFVDITGNVQRKFREILREWIALPQSSELKTDLVDAATGLRALRELTERVAYTRMPTGTITSPGPQFSELVTLFERANETSTKLAGLPTREANRIRERAQEILECLRGNSVPGHIERVETVLSSVLQYLPGAAPQASSEWKQHVVKLRAEGYLSSGSSEVRAIEQFLLSIEDDSTITPIALLDWSASAPVQTLYLLKAACDSAEALIAKLAEHVAAYLGHHGSVDTTTIEDIQRIGQRLAKAAEGLESGLHHER